MLTYLEYLTYCKICDWFYSYTDTDLASLNNITTINRSTNKYDIYTVIPDGAISLMQDMLS